MPATKEEALKAVQDFIGNTSLSRQETMDGLEEIASLAESQLDAMDQEDS